MNTDNDKKSRTNRKMHDPIQDLPETNLAAVGRGDDDVKDSASIFDSNISMKPIEWTNENELILVEWCDVAQCYKWLCNRAFLKYSVMQAWFTIPAIIMSTVTGTATFAQPTFSENMQFYVRIMVGTINICVGILTTVQQYLKVAQLSEEHRISSLAWDKFSRNIRIELSKSPIERMEAGHFLKLCRHEYDRLMETSPAITQEIVNEFKSTFQGRDGTEQNDTYKELRKPDICDTIISANQYRHHWYKEPKPELLLTCPIMSSNIMIEEKEEKEEKERKDREDRERERENREQQKKDEMNRMFQKNVLNVAKKIKASKDKIENYIALFKATYGREPIESEIYDHFRNDVDEPILKQYFENLLEKRSLGDDNV